MGSNRSIRPLEVSAEHKRKIVQRGNIRLTTSRLRYDERMKAKLDPQTTPEQKFSRFQNALRRVLTVSKDDLKERIAEDEKMRRLRKAKPGPRRSSASGHVADSK